MTSKIKFHPAIKSFWRILTLLYPPPLVIIAFFPIITGFLINANSFNSHQVKVILLWIPIIATPYIITRKKAFLYLSAFPVLFIGSLELLHWVAIGGPASIASWYVMFETNLAEAWEFAIMRKSLLALLLPVYIAGAIILLRYYRVNRSKINNTDIKVSYLIVVLFIGIFIYRMADSKFLRTIPSFLRSSIEYSKEVEDLRQLATEIKSEEFLIEATAPTPGKEQIHILILGESTNRSHMQLYGYHRETSPLLSARNDLLIYTDVICPNVHSQPAIKKMLTLSNSDNDITYTASPNLMNVFSAAGFHSYWISNQAPVGIWDNTISLIAKSADKNVFVNLTGDSEHVLRSLSYDEKLFNPIQIALNESKYSKKFILIHLMGTHMFYKYRYPESYDVFKEKNQAPEEQIIAEYDNAVLYMDYVVNRILDMIKEHSHKKKAISSVIFISDHGEDVYDSEVFLGHDWNNLTYPMVEIPFITWISDEFIQTYPAKFQQMKNNLSRAYMTDDLFHSMLDLSGIKVDLLSKSQSIFNNKLIDRQRIVNGYYYTDSQKLNKSE